MDLEAMNKINHVLRGRVLHALYAYRFAPIEHGLEFAIRGSTTCEVLRIVCEPDDRYTVSFWRVKPTRDLEQIAAYDHLDSGDLMARIESTTGVWLDLAKGDR